MAANIFSFCSDAQDNSIVNKWWKEILRIRLYGSEYMYLELAIIHRINPEVKYISSFCIYSNSIYRWQISSIPKRNSNSSHRLR
ncbi:hypothetical protein FKM82_023342 [Ascaphus truei]